MDAEGYPVLQQKPEIGVLCELVDVVDVELLGRFASRAGVAVSLQHRCPPSAVGTASPIQGVLDPSGPGGAGLRAEPESSPGGRVLLAAGFADAGLVLSPVVAEHVANRYASVILLQDLGATPAAAEVCLGLGTTTTLLILSPSPHALQIAEPLHSSLRVSTQGRVAPLAVAHVIQFTGDLSPV